MTRAGRSRVAARYLWRSRRRLNAGQTRRREELKLLSTQFQASRSQTRGCLAQEWKPDPLLRPTPTEILRLFPSRISLLNPRSKDRNQSLQQRDTSHLTSTNSFGESPRTSQALVPGQAETRRHKSNAAQYFKILHFQSELFLHRLYSC